MDDKDLKDQFQYYWREKLYHAMQSAALGGLRKYSGDATFRMYNGLSLILERLIQEVNLNHLNPNVMLSWVLHWR